MLELWGTKKNNIESVMSAASQLRAVTLLRACANAVPPNTKTSDFEMVLVIAQKIKKRRIGKSRKKKTFTKKNLIISSR